MDLKLSEYMEQYGRSVLTKLEAVAFGLPDMKRGWPKRYAELEISDEMLANIANTPVSTKATRKIRSKILKKILKTKTYETTNEQLLYLMRNVNGLLKIGISVDPVRRARQLSTASGISVVCLAAWRLDKNSRSIEGQLHKKFTKYRLEGEWFKPNSITVEGIERSISCNYEMVHSDDFEKVKDFLQDYDEYKFSDIRHKTEKAILFVIGGAEIWCPKSRVFHLNENEGIVKVRKGQFSEFLNSSECV